MKAQFRVSDDAEKTKQLMKDMLYMADYLSKMKLKYKIQEDALERRDRLYKAAKREATKNEKKKTK